MVFYSRIVVRFLFFVKNWSNLDRVQDTPLSLISSSVKNRKLIEDLSMFLTLLRSKMLLRSRSNAVEHLRIWVIVAYCSFVRQSSHIRMSSSPINAAIGVRISWLSRQKQLLTLYVEQLWNFTQQLRWFEFSKNMVYYPIVEMTTNLKMILTSCLLKTGFCSC